jgi:hypothetical protein
MLASINSTLKVLTPTLAERLRVFNQAARALQKQGIRLLRFDPAQNSLTVSPEVGAKLVASRQVTGYQRYASAGSTRYIAQFQGVTLEWRESISAARPEDWAPKIFH